MSFVISLAAGFGVGLLYYLVKVQSPAPPLVALAGLLGIVLGEHAIPVVKEQFFAQTQQVISAQQDASAKIPAPPNRTDE
jgi:XapX domain-containing protein